MTEPNLRFPAVFCGNLRFSAKIHGFLRFPAPSKCFSFQEKGWICENLRFWLSLSPQFRPLKSAQRNINYLRFIHTVIDRDIDLVDISAPKKKIDPPPPQFPNSAQNPPGPSAPPVLETHPLLRFSKKKTTPPPSRGLGLPLPPPWAEKKKISETPTKLIVWKKMRGYRHRSGLQWLVENKSLKRGGEGIRGVPPKMLRS